MFSKNLSNTTHWYAIHTHSRQEERANSNLRSLPIETFVPRIKERRFNQFSGKVDYVIKPFFPGYIFARFVASEMLHKVRFTRGVHSIAGFYGSPTPIDDETIEIIRQRMGPDYLIRIGPDLKVGDQVRITDGPLKDFVGIFGRNMRGSERVMVLLETVRYQAHIVIEQEKLEKIS